MKYIGLSHLRTNLAVHILIHLTKYLVRALFRRRLILWHFHNRPNLEEKKYKKGRRHWYLGEGLPCVRIKCAADIFVQVGGLPDVALANIGRLAV